jgi:hypothetical protein
LLYEADNEEEASPFHFLNLNAATRTLKGFRLKSDRQERDQVLAELLKENVFGTFSASEERGEGRN